MDAEKIVADLLRSGAICLPGKEGHSPLDGSMREFVIQREDVLRAIHSIRAIPWQSINMADKSLALEIRENVLHALTVMEHSMMENELRF